MKQMHALGALCATLVGGLLSLARAGAAVAGGQPGYEPAYFGGATVFINAIEVPQNPTQHAQADFYEVVYPVGWQSLGLAPPQCSPCDHDQNGIDFEDFHDHVLDSIPSNPGHGEYNPLWHVFVVVPAYTGDAGHHSLVNTAYAAHLPATSEAAVDGLIASTLPDGSPVAVMIDTHFYFLCAVVNPHAAH
jgi:hypothetical protein